MLADVTVDSTGTPLGNCTVDLFRVGDNSWVARTTSDGSGNYSFTLPENAGLFFTRAYKVGAPDVFGTTKNSLVAV